MKTYQYYTFQNEVVGIKVTDTSSNVVTCVPLTQDNSDYAEIMRQVEAGELTIEDAD